METIIHVHDSQPTAKLASDTLWLDIPIATDGSAKFVVYLQAAQAADLAEALAKKAALLLKIADLRQAVA